MSAHPTSDPTNPVPVEHYPQCLRCGKPVDVVFIRPKPGEHDSVVVEYECHGERVTQEMEADIMRNTEALAACTAFNEYTSGLMPGRAD